MESTHLSSVIGCYTEHRPLKGVNRRLIGHTTTTAISQLCSPQLVGIGIGRNWLVICLRWHTIVDSHRLVGVWVWIDQPRFQQVMCGIHQR